MATATVANSDVGVSAAASSACSRLCLALAPAAHAGGPASCSAPTEDAVRSTTLAGAKAQMDLLALAGFRAVRITQIWAPGEQQLAAPDETVLAQRRDRLRSSTTCRCSRRVLQRGQQDDAAHGRPTRPTSPPYAAVDRRGRSRASRPSSSATSRTSTASGCPSSTPTAATPPRRRTSRLLAKTYDALKAAAPTVTVLGGARLAARQRQAAARTRQTHSPTVFIHDLGSAYRASGRTTPIMDAFAFHPYEDNSSVIRPCGTHPNSTTIALADYPKLVASLGDAFAGTAQLGYELPIWYDEFGVETADPGRRSSSLHGDGAGDDEAGDRGDPGAATTARRSQLVFCQPNVRGSSSSTRSTRRPVGLAVGPVLRRRHAEVEPRRAVRLAMQQSRRGVIAHCPGLAARRAPAS